MLIITHYHLWQVNNMKRNTVQRQIILETLKKHKIHPTVDELYVKIYENHPSISKATVYRNLRQLTKHGIIRQISLPDGLERYDGNAELHYHFNCKSCDVIVDIFIEPLAELNANVQKQYGVQVEEHDVVFSGLCLKCKTKGGAQNT